MIPWTTSASTRSAIAVDPTRSQKSAVTRRRDDVSGGAAAAPQAEQKRASGASVAPQRVHVDTRGGYADRETPASGRVSVRVRSGIPQAEVPGACPSEPQP